MSEDVIPEVSVDPPTEPGFYQFSGGQQRIMFLITASGNGSQWYGIFDNGIMDICDWGFIEQALSVWKLKKVVSDDEPADVS